MLRFTTVALILAALLPATVAAQAPIGDFYFTEDADAFSDEDRSHIFTGDIEGGNEFLGFKCMSDGLNVVLGLGRYYGGDQDDDILVRWRIDDNKPSDRNYWRLFQDHTAAWLRMNRVPEFVREAREGRRVVFRFTDPLDGETHDAQFSLRGLARALAHLPCFGH